MLWSEEYKLILSILNKKDEGVVTLDGINLDRFIDIAREEGLSCLLFKNLKEKGLLHLFPLSVQKSLEESYLLTITHNIILMDDLLRVVSSLEHEGIRTIVLKGGALLERVYPDIGVRPITDIDLLFYDEENGNAGEILEGIGYRLISTCPVVYDNGRTVLDIHKEIDSFTRLGAVPYGPKLSNASLWEDSHPWKEGFKSVRILSPEDNVLALSIHIMKHSFLRILWFVDIIELIKKNPEIDWKKIGQRAKESGFEKLLFYVLSYLNEISGLIPEDFLSEIKPKETGLIEQMIIKRIFENQRSEGYGDVLYFYMIRGAFRRILLAGKILFPARERMIDIAGSKCPYLYYLYYPKRIFGILKMGGKVLWNYIIESRSSASVQTAAGSIGGGIL